MTAIGLADGVTDFWEFLGGVFWLNPETFQAVAYLQNGLWFTLVVVLGAGLSLSVAQSIMLFINQVQPVRFVFSLLINAVLFTAGFLFLVFSTWLITLLPGAAHVPLAVLTFVLGISYAPLLFGFLGALPYLGGPILTVLSTWHLLALVVGFASIANLSLPESVGYVVVGWGVLQVLQQVIGQPIANLGRWIANQVAGVDLVTGRQDVLELVRSRMAAASSPFMTSAQRPGNLAYPLPDAQAFIQSARSQFETVIGQLEEQGAAIADDLALRATRPNAAATLVMQPQSRRWRWLQVALSLLGMALLAYLVAVMLRPVREGLFGWYTTLPRFLRWLFNLGWIGVVAIAFAGLLAPLETLGWWAGWYEDEVDTTLNLGQLADPTHDPSTVSHYLIYLDGIGQSTNDYLPDVEVFLEALIPSLPPDVALIRGLVGYSVLNNPLDEDRPLAFLWRLADKQRWTNPASLLGLLVNIRNFMIVGVSSDKRYGPLYNHGIAQIMHNALIKHGYVPGSGVPITLIGYSGGGQMACAAAPLLKRSIGAPLDVISLGGVISANNNLLKLEHLYHLVGGKDTVERLGPIMFPGRWRFFPLSYWNRARRLGKISRVSLGAEVGHQLPGGLMDPAAKLPDGRTYLQQTVDVINQILAGTLLNASDRLPIQPSNYALYKENPLNQTDTYPLDQTVDPRWYQPTAEWMGRLILPTQAERATVRGVWLELYHAPDDYSHWVGQRVILRWAEIPMVRYLVAAVTRDVHFSPDAEYTSQYEGMIHPVRLNHWQRVGPLESLAGSHPVDDVIVRLAGTVTVEPGTPAVLRIDNTPVETTGRFYALVQFVEALGEGVFRVVHFNRDSRAFDGLTETVLAPPVVKAQAYGSYPSTMQGIERSPLNATGWYIHGAKNADGQFVVQALVPRRLGQVQPDRLIVGRSAGYRYLRKEAWAKVAEKKGTVESVLITPEDWGNQAALDQWQEGDRALVIHTYGGIGGTHAEPAAAPVFFGHFAYGVATVVHEPLADERRFEIAYHQVYTHNTDGLIAGTLDWARYMGDRQFGWAGNRPTCDILIKLDTFTEPFETRDGQQRSALGLMLGQLQAMTARYRIGDGTGGTYVGPANNCSQDSNQALFNSLRYVQEQIEATSPAELQAWLADNPSQAQRYQNLVRLRRSLVRELQTFGNPRSDWEHNEYNLGSTLEDAPLRNLWIALSSWRTLLPRFASDTIVRVFLQHNATVWVLRTNQIGGHDPTIEPIAPMTL